MTYDLCYFSTCWNYASFEPFLFESECLAFRPIVCDSRGCWLFTVFDISKSLWFWGCSLFIVLGISNNQMCDFGAVGFALCLVFRNLICDFETVGYNLCLAFQNLVHDLGAVGYDLCWAFWNLVCDFGAVGYDLCLAFWNLVCSWWCCWLWSVLDISNYSFWFWGWLFIVLAISKFNRWFWGISYLYNLLIWDINLRWCLRSVGLDMTCCEQFRSIA